jgi:hypothetical protein
LQWGHGISINRLSALAPYLTIALIDLVPSSLVYLFNFSLNEGSSAFIARHPMCMFFWPAKISRTGASQSLRYEK